MKFYNNNCVNIYTVFYEEKRLIILRVTKLPIEFLGRGDSKHEYSQVMR